MDYFDPFRPRYCPVVDSAPYRYSVGAYRGRKRVVIAWFLDEKSASDYCRRWHLYRPDVKFDCLKSIF